MAKTFIQFTKMNMSIKLPKGFGDYYKCVKKFTALDMEHPGEAHVARNIGSDWHKILEELPANCDWRPYDYNSQGGKFGDTIMYRDKMVKEGLWKMHQLPDFNKPIAMICRGKSALGWQERYPRDQFTRIGVNPGVNRERNWSNLQPDDLDAVISVDASYWIWAASNFLETYHGPLIGPPSAKDNWIQVGPGTYHGIAASGMSQSLTYGLQSCRTMGSKEIHIVGCDLTDAVVQHRRDNHLHEIRAIENSGVEIFIDKHSKFEELKKQHKKTKAIS